MNFLEVMKNLEKHFATDKRTKGREMFPDLYARYYNINFVPYLLCVVIISILFLILLQFPIQQKNYSPYHTTWYG